MLERFFLRVLFATLSLLLLVAPSSAWAAFPDLPGDGISITGTFGSCGAGYANAFVNSAGTLATGCDLLADSPDQDRDGYNSDGTLGTAGTTYTDCDDTDRRVYPGEYVGTGGTLGAPTGYKLCQTNGSYGSNVLNATTPLCESPNGVTHCFYVDATSGVDAANNCQTYATPCATLAKLSGGSGGSGLPAGAITLAADDIVYYKSGSNTTSFTMTIGGVGSIPVLFASGSAGTSGHPVTVKQYPGFTGTQTLANGIAIFLAHDWYTIDGLMGSAARTSLNHSGSFIDSSNNDDIVIKNIYASASVYGDYNGACIKTSGNNRSNLHHNFLRDCKEGTTGNVDNVSAIEWLDDESAGQGADQTGSHNVIWWASYSNSVNGSCWFNKHGTYLSDTGTNGYRVRYSYCINPRHAVFWQGSGLRFKGNLMYSEGAGHNVGSSYQFLGRVDDGADGGRHEDNRFQYNTWINMSMLYWRIPVTSGSPSLTFDHNVVVDNDGTYSAGNNEGLISVWPAGLDADFTNFKTYIVANSNIYYNGSATINFQYMSDTGSGKNTGGNYTFANWQALGPFDSSPASYVENPTHNAQYECSSAHCAPTTVGWLAATEAAAASGPSLVLQMSPQKKKKKR